jgi:parallel beta-helix repeat protein
MKTTHQSVTGNWVIRLALSTAFTLWVVFNTSFVMASSGTLHITSSTTLTEDHYGNVLIEGNNITLDCAGRTVSGPGVEGFSGGIQVQFSTSITVKRCKVTAFGVNGIYAVDSNNSRYENNKLIGNGANGIHLEGGVANLIIGNTVRGGAGNGIAITRSSQTLIEQNTVQDQKGSCGILVGDGSHHNMVVGNTSTRNNIGVLVDSSWENDLINNIVTSNAYQGFNFIRGANSNSAWLNASNGNMFGFEVNESSSQNLFGRNIANENHFEGFKIFNSNSNSLTGNIANENGTFGFLVFGGSSFTVVSRNAAHENRQADGYDEGSGTGNVWMANRFGTTIGF